MRLLVLLTFIATGVQAQTEAALKAFFEGKTVAIRQDLPAGKDGLDIFPKAQPMVDFKRYAERLRQFGPALHQGDSAKITAVRVKEKSIEFELKGTQFDVLGSAFLNIRYSDKSLKTVIPTPEQLAPFVNAYADLGKDSPRNTSALSDPSVKLKKGMTEIQVLGMLGAPLRSRQHMESGVTIVTNSFRSGQESYEVDFVKNVVVDYRVLSR